MLNMQFEVCVHDSHSINHLPLHLIRATLHGSKDLTNADALHRGDVSGLNLLNGVL